MIALKRRNNTRFADIYVEKRDGRHYWLLTQIRFIKRLSKSENHDDDAVVKQKLEGYQ